jgi:hypothetical protein
LEPKCCITLTLILTLTLTLTLTLILTLTLTLTLTLLVVNDWNRNVVQFTGSITEYLNTDSVLNLINKQFLLKGTTRRNVSAILPISYEVDGEKNGKRTIVWNSKRPWEVQSTVNFVEGEHNNDLKDKSISINNFMIGNVTKTGKKNGIFADNVTKTGKKNGIFADNHSRISPEVPLFNRIDNESRTLSEKKTVNDDNRNNEYSSISTSLLNDITKKKGKDSNTSTTKKISSEKPSAFTSYLQSLLEP